MTVDSSYTEKTYFANGTTTMFPWTSDYDSTYGALVVTRIDASGEVLETYVEGTDYTIIENTVVFNTAPADGTRIHIDRHTYRGQEVTFIEGEDFPAKDYETSLDRLFMIEQEQDKALEKEIEERIAADAILQDNINAEATARQNADTTLQENIDAVAASIGDGTITLRQKGAVIGSFTTNQKTNTTIDLDGDGENKDIIIIDDFAISEASSGTDVAGRSAIEVTLTDERIIQGQGYIPFFITTMNARHLAPSANYFPQNQSLIVPCYHTAGVFRRFSGKLILMPTDTEDAAILGATNGLFDNTGSSSNVFALDNEAQKVSNLVTSLSSSSTDTQYPSAKCVYDALGVNKQPLLLDNITFRNDTAENVDQIRVSLSDVTYEEGVSYIPFVWLLGDVFAQYISAVYIETDRINGGYSIVVKSSEANIPPSANSTSFIILLPIKDNPVIAHYYGAVNNGNKLYQLKGNLVTSVSELSTDTQYPSAKCVYDRIAPLTSLNGTISNCTLEIPQNINLELNNGTITLKAGSKVYIPNGAGVFDELVLTEDKTATSALNGTLFVYYTDANAFTFSNASYSGATEPAGIASRNVWYDTANNVIKRYFNNAWQNLKLSFPIAQITVTSGAISSIDKVFKGAGYVGHHAFVVPGVSGLKPNGLTAKGIMASNLWENASAQVVELLSTCNNVMSRATGVEVRNYYEDINNAPNDSTPYQVAYDIDKNKMYYRVDGSIGWLDEKGYYINIANYTYDGSSVTKFEVIQPFRTVSQAMLNSTLGNIETLLAAI